MTNALISALTVLAAIATIGSVILGILQYRARRPLLRATVYVHDISLPIYLQTYLRQLWRDGQPSGEAPDPSDKLAVLAGLRSYVHLTLQNRGREKISALTLTIMDRTSQHVFQVDRQATPLPQQDGKVVLESVQELHEGLQSFRNMRRMEAKRKKASALTFRFSQSLGKLRQGAARQMPALPAWLNDHRLLIIYLFLGCCLCAHFFRWLNGYQPLALLILLMIVAAFCFVAFMFEPIVYLRDVFVIMAIYGVTLYIVLCEVLLQGAAHWLTKTRGAKWVTELDYVYLTLGLVGIFGSVNRIEQVSGRFSKVDILAPMVLVTAVVIRFLKTRAEIGGWHRPDFVPPKRRFLP